MYIFPALVIMVFCLRLYLNWRQARAIKNHFTWVPMRFKQQVPLKEHQKSASYTLSKLKLNNFNNLINSLLLIIFTVGGLISYLDNLIYQHFADISGLSHGVMLIVAISVINLVVELPFSLYNTFKIEERFAFNHMTIGLFFIDMLKTVVITAIIGIPMCFLVLWLMNIMGGLWWLWVWGAFCLFNLAIMLIYPTIIAPLFNKFSPLADEQLKTRIYELLNKCGFQSNGIFVMDNSKRSSHGNAYFTGIGKTKRIVFFDTLVKQLTHGEIEAILAHELGHFKRKHILKQIAISLTMTLVMLYLLSLIINQPWFFNALGVANVSNYSGLILFFMALGIVTFPLSPITSYLSRRNEFEADDFAKQYSSKEDLINGLVKLYRENASTLTPDNLYAKFYYSHPPASIRIAHLEQAH